MSPLRHVDEAPAPQRPSPRGHLLNERTADSYQTSVTEVVGRLAQWIPKVDQPTSGITAPDLAADVNRVDLERPLGDMSEALDEVESLYLRDAVYFHHPRYMAHLNCPVVIPAVAAETLLSTVNSSLDTWDQSVGATLIERRLIDWSARRVGFGANADGVFTSGGTQSNLQALLLAREEARARHLGPGDDPLPRLRVFASECAHFSVRTSASLLGLAPDSVIAVPCDDERRMRVDHLAGEIARCREAGLIPMAVVATAGTTDFGSIDPLGEIADLCRSRMVWLHVDAAYGCGLLVSRRSHLLAGVESADSVTIDFHKSFFQPVSSSAVLVRDRATLRHVTHHADYLNPAHTARDHTPNLVDNSIQTTRRFDALKLWLTLRVLGADGVGALFDEVVDRAAEAWELLAADPRFEVVNQPRLSTLVFRYRLNDDSEPWLWDRVNDGARDSLLSSGRAMVAATTVDGRRFLKLTLLNPETTVQDVAAVLDLVAEHARAAEYAELTTTP
ncbi:aspartate aminotransferase family protein [Spiractinospora alimapuensis]|uniref:pyridoxal phosphate-dependent decarboxylase family protein n=1 Tax=Spiractinospora alimapuensis TaxID=2820884 RepID=UPI001F47C6BC|nr:aspartate aminotransferase family protein [Spiractinospora alimapuensis]QVQ50131.1 aspartate aminotransferase family protein [Spiractinospora alimapuensis]